MRRWQGIVVGLIGLTLTVSCTSGSPERASRSDAHRPVTSTRATVLPTAPLPISQALTSLASTWLSGSPDRLVVSHGIDPSGTSSRRAHLAVAAFNFRHKSWQRLPNAPWNPVALPDGLAGVGLQCGADDDGNAPCQIEVATLRWDVKAWHHQQVTKRAVSVHEGGSVQPLGVRGRWAYFRVFREQDQRILRVSANGEIRTLPPRPAGDRNAEPFQPVLCPAPGGLDTVRIATAANLIPAGRSLYDFMKPGPVQHLDDRRAATRWHDVPGTDPLALPEAGTFVCGAQGLVLVHPNGTSAWTNEKFATLSNDATPPLPAGGESYLTANSFADGGLMFTDGKHISRLRAGHWETTAVNANQTIAPTTVGNLIVYAAVNPLSGATELRVLP